MASPSIPDFMERKGSLFLRSDHMDYGRETLVSNWNQARESEPKDYDIKDIDPAKRRLHLSTYKRVGNGNINTSSLISTSHDQMQEAIKLKSEFQPKETRVPMINKDNFDRANLNRDTGCPDRGYGSVLPRHSVNHNKRYLDTTQRVDFQPPYPYTPKTPEIDDPYEYNSSPLWKKCHSQFTDVDDYRRHGNNTWHNQSGCYSNQEIRGTVVPKTDTIPSRLL